MLAMLYAISGAGLPGNALCGSSTDGLPPGVDTIPGPRTQRQVLPSLLFLRCRIAEQ